MESPQVDKIFEPWKALQVAVEEFIETFHSVFTPWANEVIQATRSAYISLCRVQLYFRLLQKWWIPRWLARCLSNWCPEQWLPELRFREPETMKGATSETA